MRKAKVIQFFGSVELTAHAMGVSGPAVRKWPDKLTQALADRAVGAALRSAGLPPTRRAFPGWFDSKRF